LSVEFGSAYTRTFGIATTKRPVALSPLTTVSSSEPMLATTTARVVPLGKTMTIVSGSVPCSILIFTGVDVTGAVDGDAIGFVDGCPLTRGAAGLSNAAFVLSISTAPVSGMLMNRT